MAHKYPEYDEMIDKFSKEHGLDPELVRNIIWQESGGNPRAISKKGAIGLMQIMPKLGALFGYSTDDLKDPEKNLKVGTAHFADMMAKYKGNVGLALAAYNAGSPAVDAAGGIPHNDETPGYVKNILASYQKSKPPAKAEQKEVSVDPATAVRIIGPKGQIYEVSPEEAKKWTTPEKGWRQLPGKKKPQAEGEGRSLWDYPFAPFQLLQQFGQQAQKKLETTHHEEMAKAAQTGQVPPQPARGFPDPKQFGLQLASSGGRIIGGLGTPLNAGLALASLNPIGRAAVGGGMAGAGTLGAIGAATNKGGLGNPDNLENFLLNLSGVAAGVAGTKSGVGDIKAARTNPEALTKAGTELMTKGVSTAKPDFQPKLERAVTRGHLPEIERRYHPSTVREAADAVSEYMNEFLEKNVKEPLKGQSGIIKGDDIAGHLQKLKTTEVQEYAPEEMRVIEREINRYRGKDVQVKDAYEHLKRLNQMTARLRKATPADAAGAARVNGRIRANIAAASMLREQLYMKMQELGQPIQDFNVDYGALSAVQDHLQRNIGRAEKIGKGPSLSSEYLGYHGTPWLILAGGGGLLSSSTGSEGAGMVGVGAATVPFLRWAMRRRGTPNALIDRAFGKFGKIPGQPQQQQPPPTPAGLLPPGPIMGGSPTEPIEQVGPTGQPAAHASVPGRTPPGQPGAGRYKRQYTTESTFQRPPVQEHEARPPEPTPAPAPTPQPPMTPGPLAAQQKPITDLTSQRNMFLQAIEKFGKSLPDDPRLNNIRERIAEILGDNAPTSQPPAPIPPAQPKGGGGGFMSGVEDMVDKVLKMRGTGKAGQTAGQERETATEKARAEGKQKIAEDKRRRDEQIKKAKEKLQKAGVAEESERLFKERAEKEKAKSQSIFNFVRDHIGEEVSIKGKKGKVVGTAFGKITVEMDDKTMVRVDPAELPLGEKPKPAAPAPTPAPEPAKAEAGGKEPTEDEKLDSWAGVMYEGKKFDELGPSQKARVMARIKMME